MKKDKKHKNIFKVYVMLVLTLPILGCSKEVNKNSNNDANTNTVVEIVEQGEDMASNNEEKYVEALSPIKNPMDHNPLMTQSFSADPYALVFEGRVYLYLTGDKYMYEADGSIKTNNYSNIDTIHVISSADLVNWTDHGEIKAAGKEGAANWGNNSWAPAACVKIIDGKPKFFLYFANSGNGIAVLTADSPIGPFVDPLGEAIVSRNTPTCAEVTWLFDPAVLVDDDGQGYLYFGGGVPSPDKAQNPGTARVAKLTDDMIHLAEDPVPIENVLYLFEDSGINKVGDKYIYSYCSNFDVPEGGCEGYGFGNGEIIIMSSDSPMGSFKTERSILKNPGSLFKYGGNNHHCMFEFEGKWYVTYHASLIEEKLGEYKGYRSVNIDEIKIGEDGLFDNARGTKEGVSQVCAFNPYKLTTFTTMANQAGINLELDERVDNEEKLVVKVNEQGAFIQISGADFEAGASKCTVNVSAPFGGSISIRTKYLNSKDCGRVDLEENKDYKDYEINLLENISGENDFYFVFEGKDLMLNTFVFAH